MIWEQFLDMGNVIQPIEFERESIGHVLKDKSLHVPKNQRPYSWEKEHVTDLYQDLWGAFGSEEYFLGSIVVVKSRDRLEVNDGQQRLATSLILIAAIRDYFVWKKESKTAKKIQDKYLLTEDIRTDEAVARLHLSGQDHEFFLNRILRPPDDPLRVSAQKQHPDKPSNDRLLKAAQIAKKFVNEIGGVTAATEAHKRTKLLDWLDFLEKSARVIWVQVADSRTAYLIFETMNDRGLKLSSADLLKNYIFGEAQEREDEAFEKWQRMVATLENLSEGEATVVDYIRYFWIATRGPVRSRELYDKIKASIKNKTEAMTLVTELEDRAGDYAALSTPTADKWNAYGPSVRKQIATLDILGAKQVRTMLLAALPDFSVKQMTSLLRASICWSVRFLISGVPSGNLESYYGKVALEIKNRKLRKVSDITKIMVEWVPTDERFESSFANASVSQPPLVTYYLRALQLKADGESEPEYIPNDGSDINREHIMPEGIDCPEWAHIPKDLAKQFLNRLGNQVLLKETENSAIGNKGFDVKRPVLFRSKYSLTKLAGAFADWNLDNIRTRQNELAKWAIKTWPYRH